MIMIKLWQHLRFKTSVDSNFLYYATIKIPRSKKNKKLDTFEKKWITYKDLLENT